MLAQQNKVLNQKKSKDSKEKQEAKERQRLLHACESDEDIDNEGDEGRASAKIPSIIANLQN